MATLTVRGLDDSVKARLRKRAAAHGHSMEAEARAILRDAVAAPVETGADLAHRVQQRFAGLHDVELELPSRRGAPRPARLPE